MVYHQHVLPPFMIVLAMLFLYPVLPDRWQNETSFALHDFLSVQQGFELEVYLFLHFGVVWFERKTFNFSFIRNPLRLQGDLGLKLEAPLFLAILSPLRLPFGQLQLDLHGVLIFILLFGTAIPVNLLGCLLLVVFLARSVSRLLFGCQRHILSFAYQGSGSMVLLIRIMKAEKLLGVSTLAFIVLNSLCFSFALLAFNHFLLLRIYSIF